MGGDNQELKNVTRKVCLNRRAALEPEERKAKSLLIQQKLYGLKEFQDAETVMSFLDFRQEVESTAIAELLIEQKKKLVLPRCAEHGIIIPLVVCDLEADLESGAWGIREPKLCNEEVDPSEIDLVIMPGAGFDLTGNRIGYGGGFYDRFFVRLNPSVPKIALAFHTQVIEQVPVDKHDSKITILVTEDDVYDFRIYKD